MRKAKEGDVRTYHTKPYVESPVQQRLDAPSRQHHSCAMSILGIEDRKRAQTQLLELHAFGELGYESDRDLERSHSSWYGGIAAPKGV